MIKLVEVRGQVLGKNIIRSDEVTPLYHDSKINFGKQKWKLMNEEILI